MDNFFSQKISQSVSLGEKLREVRLEKNWSLEDIAKHLSIKKDYLTAIEENDFTKLPSGLYRTNFVNKYAKLLKVNPKDFLTELNSTTNLDNPFSKKIISRHRFIVFPKLVRNFLIFLAVLACFLYLIIYARNLTLPPKLTLITPNTNISLSDSSYLISGQTEKEAEIRINGEIILADEMGYFEKDVNLKKGLNSITISSKKKYSQEKVINRQILVE